MKTKKIIALLLSLTLILSMTACSKDKKEDEKKATPSVTTTVEDKTTTTPTEEVKEEVKPDTDKTDVTEAPVEDTETNEVAEPTETLVPVDEDGNTVDIETTDTESGVTTPDGEVDEVRAEAQRLLDTAVENSKQYIDQYADIQMTIELKMNFDITGGDEEKKKTYEEAGVSSTMDLYMDSNMNIEGNMDIVHADGDMTIKMADINQTIPCDMWMIKEDDKFIQYQQNYNTLQWEKSEVTDMSYANLSSMPTSINLDNVEDLEIETDGDFYVIKGKMNINNLSKDLPTDSMGITDGFGDIYANIELWILKESMITTQMRVDFSGTEISMETMGSMGDIETGFIMIVINGYSEEAPEMPSNIVEEAVEATSTNSLF